VNDPSNCPFCAIVRREAEADELERTAELIVFRDIAPQAPQHVLVVPTAHVPSLSDLGHGASDVGRHLLTTAARVGSRIAPGGFRVVINEGADGHQTIFHLHLHVLGGRTMRWPPG